MSFIWHKSQAKSSKVLFLDKLCKFDKLVVDIIDKFISLSCHVEPVMLECWRNVRDGAGNIKISRDLTGLQAQGYHESGEPGQETGSSS